MEEVQPSSVISPLSFRVALSVRTGALQQKCLVGQPVLAAKCKVMKTEVRKVNDLKLVEVTYLG